MDRSLAGSRIRQARRRAGLTQAALAREAGISPSYLNLIEHNRRRIGGATLNAIAQALNARPADLSEGRNPTAVQDLLDAAATVPAAGADPKQAEAFSARFPDWAQLLIALDRRVRDQGAVIAALSDRLTHDPFLAENVHAMLSNITAIRSTAGILAQVDDIPQLQQRRFHESISAESIRLSDTAQALADYLGSVADRTDSAATAEETLDHFLRRHGYSFDGLDREAAAAAGWPDEVWDRRLATVIDEMLDAEAAAGQGRALIHAHLRTYARDARAMPLRPFHEAAQRAGYDPAALAAEFHQDMPAVFRRLAVLRRPWIEAPRFGLIVVTASGYPLLRHALPDFALPRHGNACSLWPLFQGFSRPGQPILDWIEHDTGARFTTLTYAAPRQLERFDAPPDLAASMLFVSDKESPFASPTGRRRPVGTSCRICAHTACASRTEPQLVA